MAFTPERFDDATYVLDFMYGIDKRDNETSTQQARMPSHGYTPFLSNLTALRGAKFGLPWESFWSLAATSQQQKILELVHLLENFGASVYNGTELPTRDLLVSPMGWDWDYGTTRGYPNESEYSYVKVDFYISIKKYLSEIENTDIKSVKDRSV